MTDVRVKILGARDRDVLYLKRCYWRRERDSNPRAGVLAPVNSF